MNDGKETTTTKRPASSSASPSFTVQLSKADAEGFLKACDAIAAKLTVDESSTAPHASEEATSESTAKPLHEQMHQAASGCDDETVVLYRNRLGTSCLTQSERVASFLLFHKSELDAKLDAFFSAFSPPAANSEPRANLLSLFRTLLASITCCSARNTSCVVVEGEPETKEPPRKKARREEDTASTKDSTHCDSTSKELQASSFDISLATVHDDDHDMLKEIEEVALFATDQLLTFVKEKALDIASVHALKEWYYEKGQYVAPWIELLSLSKWKKVAENGEKIASPSLLKQPSHKASQSSPSAKPPSPTADKKEPPQALAQASKAPEQVPSTRSPDAPKHTSPPHVPMERDVKREDTIDQIDFNKETLFDDPPKSASLVTTVAEDTSKPLVSFDFSGSGHPKPLCIEISENNLYALRHFVHRTGLMHCPAPGMCKKLLRLANRRPSGANTMLTLSRDVWMRSISDILGGEVWGQLSSVEREAFTGCFTEIFSCFEGNKPGLRSDEVDLQEFAVGFCFFCSGNKSSKLATGFEVLDDLSKSYLTEPHLRRYLSSYLTMLVAMSVLAPISSQNGTGVVGHHHHHREMRSAVESGAKWTLGHFLRHFGDHSRTHQGRYSFESFATWYSSGGYEVAPWLELLDLNKVFSLIGHSSFDGDIGPTGSHARHTRDKMSSLRRHHSGRKGPPPEILFTFPLANHRSLVVLKDDATYVRSVVDQLGLLSMNPNELWTRLSRLVDKKKKPSDTNQGTVYTNMDTFLSCMEEICPNLKRNKPNHPDRTKTAEILLNFFQCFDLEQRDSVAVDELMGGLTLLCGGKKSHKLAFAFGVFDTRPGIQQKKKKETITHSLSGEDLFLFLRSILIVTFSCCRQSLDMTDGMVGRCIADTANMICNDVMRHQWDLRHKDRLNFDEFGQWYNDGGFERAPWLELLDLKKWVLVEPLDSVKKRQDRSSETAKPPPPTTSTADPPVPPPPPEDELDPDFFESSIMPMDSIDEMDMILMQPSTDKELDLGSPRISQSFSHSPEPPQFPSPSSQSPPLKFHLSTSDAHGGYSLSMSQKRISHLRRILESSSLHRMGAEVVCNRILAKATKSKSPRLSQEAFDAAISSIVYSSHPGAREEELALFHVLTGIFATFDRDGSGRVNAMEVACGFTVLCNGKKSDKLEFAFDVLDKRKRGQLSREDMTNYLKSFLTVLLSIAFTPNLKDDARRENTLTTLQGQPCDHSPRTLMSVVDSAAFWATSMAFEGHIARHGSDKYMSMSFDDFAEWYTTKGYSSIPWLELLDLRKWVFTKEN